VRRPRSSGLTVPAPSAPALAWGGVSGIGSAVGTLALYLGYGHGQLAVAGPLFAVGAAALLLHELPDRGQRGLLLGAVAVTAIVLA